MELPAICVMVGKNNLTIRFFIKQTSANKKIAERALVPTTTPRKREE
jgi:hypothetical protein